MHDLIEIQERDKALAKPWDLDVAAADRRVLLGYITELMKVVDSVAAYYPANSGTGPSLAAIRDKARSVIRIMGLDPRMISIDYWQEALK
jgi:hypothetical protein